jgi:hypothetical protein
MADDSRKTPRLGVAIPRAITERGSGAVRSSDDRDYFGPKHKPVDLQSRNPFETEELTPVTLIKVVREELKGDVNEVKQDIHRLESGLDRVSNEVSITGRQVGQLSGEVATSNRLQADLISTIKDELKSKRDGDSVILTTQAEVVRHREITSIDDASAERKDRLAANKTKRRMALKVVTLITSTAFLTTITTLLAGRC